MEIEFIKDKVYYKIIDRTYPNSNGAYFLHNANDATKLAQVEQNINNIKKEFGYQEFFLMRQVHGNDVVIVDDETNFGQQELYDGCVTAKKNIALGVLTADCVPVLLASDDGNVIGAAHCGWRSAKANIISNVRKLMEEKGAKNIKALIGPAIAQNSYEVRADYYHNFLQDGQEGVEELFMKGKDNNSYMFDLVGYVKKKLIEENIELIYDINEDTYSNPEKYPSYRRCCHTGTPYIDNILSMIVIKEC